MAVALFALYADVHGTGAQLNDIKADAESFDVVSHVAVARLNLYLDQTSSTRMHVTYNGLHFNVTSPNR
jgi:hypothetical protein